MKHVFVYVEGQTEETFVRDMLGPYLQSFDLYLTPILARTKRSKAGTVFKGGIVSYTQVRRDILRLLHDTSIIALTTMIDYYGLPENFPGKSTLPTGSCYERVEYLEDKFREDINHPRFMPFLTLHEFEALLFVAPDQIEAAFPARQLRCTLCTEANQFSSPEEINEGQDTHPAARIRKYIPAYRKAVHGPLIAARIGLDKMREKCPHFARWIARLESLAAG